MALFESKKKAAPKKTVTHAVAKDDGRLDLALAQPWFSEKALIGTERGVYAFVIPAHTTKHDVSAAIQKIYKVTPRQVRIVNLPAKKKNLRTRRGIGTRARRHKAYVYLKKGETISFA